MTIDPEVLVADLISSWINGNLTDVVDALERDHPGLTAAFIVIGCATSLLTLSDCNTLARMLGDRRREAIRKAGK